MKQILLLEKQDLADLRAGNPMTIALPGGTSIELQVEGPHRIVRPMEEAFQGDNHRRRKRKYRRSRGGGKTHGQRIVDFFAKHGPARAVEVANALGIQRSTVGSTLTANRQDLFIRVGGVDSHQWGLKK